MESTTGVLYIALFYFECVVETMPLYVINM